MSTKAEELFVFNGDYNDEGQVAPWIGDFAIERAKLDAADQYPYNDSFRGLIAGIGNPELRGGNVAGTHEDTAIYMLQGLFRYWEQEAKIMDLLADGHVHIDELTTTTRFSHVVLYSPDRMGGGWSEYHDVRLVSDGERPGYVLPKGARTRGYYIAGRKVLAR